MGKRGPKIGTGGRPTTNSDPYSKIHRLDVNISNAKDRGDLQSVEQLKEIRECVKAEAENQNANIKDLRLKNATLEVEKSTHTLLPKTDAAQAWKDPVAVESFIQISNDPRHTPGTLLNTAVLLMEKVEREKKQGEMKFVK